MFALDLRVIWYTTALCRGRVDTIILPAVLEHAHDPALAWREMPRVLSPGGQIVMNVPLFHWPHAYSYDFYRFTEFALTRFFASRTLKLLSLEPLGGVVEAWTARHAKLMTRLKPVLAPIAALLQKTIAVWGCCCWGNDIAKVSACQFPLNYFFIAQKPMDAG